MNKIKSKVEYVNRGVSITKPLKITLSPEEIAKLWERMTSGDHTYFFNELAVLVGKWKVPFSNQLEYIKNDSELTDEARMIMKQIGEYAFKETK